MGRNILIGHDFSQTSNYALEWIIQKQILLPTDKITVAIVLNNDIADVEGPFGMEAAVISPSWTVSDFSDNTTSKQDDASMSEVVKWFANKGFTVTPQVLSGSPGQALAGYAEASQMDMVIVGSRCLGFLKRQFLGSVSEYLVNHLKCTVLVIKEDENEQGQS
ncbi:hypothetical protein DFQ29_007352 [Apophysomyces sp. BC1021]|nr:hypothetical protein DFQ29_007352 [Apophysomyces sp. BC1021]